MKITILRNRHVSIIRKCYPFIPLFVQLRISLDLPSEFFFLLDFKMYSSSQHLKDFDYDNYLVVRHSIKNGISENVQTFFSCSYLRMFRLWVKFFNARYASLVVLKLSPLKTPSIEKSKVNEMKIWKFVKMFAIIVSIYITTTQEFIVLKFELRNILQFLKHI